MIVGLLYDLVGYLLIPALILYLLYYPWFKKYVLVVISPVVYIIEAIGGIVFALSMLAPKIMIGLLKAVLIAILSVILALVYIITYVVPFIGGRAEGWKGSMKEGVVASSIVIQVRQMREIMVQIVAEEDDRVLNYEEPEEYRAELTRVKQDAKNRLETGETLLSILLGLTLLFGKLMGIKLLDASIFSVPVDLLIEGWLLVIAVSIIYRSSALEFLAYRSDDEFESLKEMDAALSYQKGISLVGFVHGLMFLVVFTAAITSVRYSVIEDALRARYANEPWIAFTWEKLKG